MPSRQTRKVTRKDFFNRIPRRSALTYFAAVFLVFAPVNLLMSSSLVQERPFYVTVFSSILSGGIAVCWAGTFTVSKWFITGIVAIGIVMSALNGPLRHLNLGMRDTAFSWELAGGVGTLAAGYALFIVFISGQARRTFRLQAEMDLARQIHETLVPAIDLSTPRLEALGVSAASSEMGGDLIDTVPHAGAIDFYLADVSGHGVRAGVVMGMVKSAVRTRLLAPGGLAEIMADLDAVLGDVTAPEMFVTFACMRIAADAGRVEYALAGHHPIIHVRAGDGSAIELENQNLPFGIGSGETYMIRSAAVSPGDLLVLYTDGLVECHNRDGRALGRDAVRTVVQRRSREPLPAIRDAIFAAATAHGAQEDDQTLLLVRVR